MKWADLMKGAIHKVIKKNEKDALIAPLQNKDIK